ncbi:ATP-dependent carboxylate-amine ligase [Kitasatospora purpeofusca]|uniref:ATP-dependent carboxylate-amine ligase n=1 Tax=Kitasatospora purpeofusca TaxID=67352 RepID=UPI0036D349D4
MPDSDSGCGTVLVITGTFDPTADLVVEELNRRAVPVFRADTAWFPSSEFPPELPSEARAVAAAEARGGFGGLLSALPPRWLPPPGRAAEAESKPLQLRVAAECGLRVPRTLITNRPEAAREFAARAGGPVVYKPFTPIRGTAGGRTVAVYASVLGPEDLGHPAVASTAHLFQEWVPKAYEVRLTVVGRRVFAAEIHAESEAARTDWRSDYDSLRYRVCEPPPEVAAGVRRVLGQLGLPYGAFDFVVTPSGEWVFLEVNPNGQYGFVEQATGLPITAAICDYLEGAMG